MSEGPLHDRLRDVADAWVPREGLRERTLDAAEPLVRGSVAWSDRVWFSRSWRLAAAFTVLAAFALDAGFGGAPATGVAPRESARAAAQAVDEAARQVGLGPEQARVFAQRAFALASRPNPDAGREFSGAVSTGEMK